MKAEILLTGEIVDVEFFEQRGTAMTNVYIETGTRRTFYEYELEFLKEELFDEEKHWQDVRERAAIAAMQAIINSDTLRSSKTEIAMNVSESPHKMIALSATLFADALVKQLKGE